MVKLKEGTTATAEEAKEWVDDVMTAPLEIKDGTEEIFSKDWEDDADELLNWLVFVLLVVGFGFLSCFDNTCILLRTTGLDFEAYQDDWYLAATCRPADKFYREVTRYFASSRFTLVESFFF